MVLEPEDMVSEPKDMVLEPEDKVSEPEDVVVLVDPLGLIGYLNWVGLGWGWGKKIDRRKISKLHCSFMG